MSRHSRILDPIHLENVTYLVLYMSCASFDDSSCFFSLAVSNRLIYFWNSVNSSADSAALILSVVGSRMTAEAFVG